MSALRRARAVPLLLLPFAACLPEATLETDAQKASYGIGLNMGRSLVDVIEHVDVPALMKGLSDGMAEVDPPFTHDEIQAAMTAFSEAIQAAAAEAGTAEGEEFLAGNSARDGVITTASGLQYEVLEQGDGPTAESGQIAVLHYRGTLTDGSVFDSSYDDDPATEDQPASFGVDNVIPGFSEALQLMAVGSRFRVVIPSDLAYGAAGAPPNIGPNQVLIFEIELLGLQ